MQRSESTSPGREEDKSKDSGTSEERKKEEFKIRFITTTDSRRNLCDVAPLTNSTEVNISSGSTSTDLSDQHSDPYRTRRTPLEEQEKQSKSSRKTRKRLSHSVADMHTKLSLH